MKTKPCPVCDCRYNKLLFVKNTYNIVRCNCGMVFVNNPPTQKELEKHYDSLPQYTEENPLIREITKEKFENELKLFFPHVPKHFVMDVGCGNGNFLYYAQKHRWIACGTEKNEIAFKNRIDEGITMLREIPKDFCKFGLITYHQVFEHILEPRKELHKVKNALDDDGCLFISVPYIYGLTARILGKKHKHFYPPEHLNYFNKKTLRKLLESEGFEIIKMGTEGFKINELVTKTTKKGNIDGLKKSPKARKLYWFVERIIRLLGLGDFLWVLAVKKNNRVEK